MSILLIPLLAACGQYGIWPSYVDVLEVEDPDGDGYPSEVDCAPEDPEIHPGATETPYNGVDDDCEPDTPDDDLDGDGFDGDRDCDDADPTLHPEAVEHCDGIDEDCDGTIDEGAGETWYADEDQDGFGDVRTAMQSCTPPEGHVVQAGDCDDTRSSTWPGAAELCNGLDEDCDGVADEGMETPFYEDRDGDGHGLLDGATLACSVPPGHVESSDDCDDSDASRHPGAVEVCGGVDEDCDGLIDEDAADAATWSIDVDGDGYGVAVVQVLACEQPIGFVANDLDCDDSHPEASPVGVEVCDGLDNDCDGERDEEDALDAGTWYADTDADGFGDQASPLKRCEAPDGYVTDATDCDDTEVEVHPDSKEICNDGIDNDCDGGPGSCRLQGTLELSAADRAWWGNGSGSGADKLSYGEHDYIGAGPGAEAGASLAAGDLDGDGVVELVIGSPLELVTYDESWLETLDPDDDGDAEGDRCDHEDQPGGAVYTLAGESVEVSAPYGEGPPAEAPLEDEAASWAYGEPTWREGDCEFASRFGGALVASDFDGDGQLDLAVGASGSNPGMSSSTDDAGAVFLFYGPLSGGELTEGAVLVEEEGDLEIGGALAASDSDGDGLAELFLGGAGGDGVVQVLPGDVRAGEQILGDEAGLLQAASAEDGLGAAVAACDLGTPGGGAPDGVADLVIGAPLADSGGASSGVVYVVYGPLSTAGSIDEAAELWLVGEEAGDGAGSSLACGDVDADGYDDLLIGAPGADEDAGATYALHGPLGAGELDLSFADFRIVGEAGSALGSSVSVAGDVDGDGAVDWLLGAAGDEENGSDSGYTAGAAWLIYGPVTGDLALPLSDDAGAKLLGADWDDLAGAAVSAAGDWNGDGYDDFLVGAPRADDPDGTWNALSGGVRCSKASEGGCTDPPGGAYLVLGRGL